MNFPASIKTAALFTIFLLTGHSLLAQPFVLPEPVTNQSLVVLKKNNSEYIYTFYGLDSTKQWSGVHRKVFRLNLSNGLSAMIGQVPDSLGRLASSAVAINNKAYIVGGYAVYPNGKEKSSGQLFIFDPATESFVKGANLPIPIDDHVQAVWRDSLVYVVSGWNDSNNVRTVQVYDPATNHWQLASPLPNEITAAVFGGCGTIVGDTIYILGGATFTKFFPPSRQFYKGAIDKTNPSIITWINAGEYPGECRYRSVAFEMEGKIYFWGGSNETYNYNGISYEQKKPVEPNKTVLIFEIARGVFTTRAVSTRVMDLRNAGGTSKHHWYVAGGMGPGQQIIKTLHETSFYTMVGL